jgi:CMP/dCMP kinase
MSTEKPYVIAIDGPAASGKSTLAIALARRLGFRLVDSGSMYRAVTLVALERDVVLINEKGLELAARTVSQNFRFDLPKEGPPRMWLGVREITKDVRSAAVGDAVSPVSRVGAVREEMVRLQRSMVSGRGAVVEGRDIGTTVFPDAPFKVFLKASPEERTRRRFVELQEKRMPMTWDEVAGEIATRDLIDSSRELSPLAMAPDAFVLDTTDMSLEQVVDTIVMELKARGLKVS